MTTPSFFSRIGPLTPAGTLFSLLLAVFLVLAAGWWWKMSPSTDHPSVASIRRNEARAYDHLQRIISAQRAYYRKSEAIFGERRYAAFVTHLWVAVDPAGGQVPLDLIPERLAVAVGTTKATGGYYFLDVRERVKLPQRDFQPVDYRREWLVAAIPQLANRTGSLIFMADQTGAVFARPVATFSSLYPFDPAADGWTAIPTADALSGYQRSRTE